MTRKRGIDGGDDERDRWRTVEKRRTAFMFCIDEKSKKDRGVGALAVPWAYLSDLVVLRLKD
jgi:hypothetical protein